MDTEEEKIYTTDGKEFPRKYQKFGDICLTEKNERIFVCTACKCLSATPSQFWKHQRDEHDIRGYQNTSDNTENDVVAGAEKERRESGDSTSAAAVGKRTRSRERLQNGVDREAAVRETRVKLTETVLEQHTDDSPLLMKALRDKTKAPNVRESPATQFIPRATQEELYDALNSSCNDDNYNEFILYCCPECGKQFQTDAQWKQHTAAVHNFFAPNNLNISLHKKNPDGSTVYKCDICRVLLKKPNLAPLRRHKLTHMPFKSFCCRLCGQKIRHKSGIVHHIRTVHRKGREMLHKCDKCQHDFYTKSKYMKHFKLGPGGSLLCTGRNFINNYSPQTYGINANNTDVINITPSNAMSEDGNYDNSFDNPNRSSIEDECDRSEFIKTEKEDPGNTQNELYMDIYDIDIKEEPPELADDISDEYGELWQGDAALIAEEQLKLKAKASQERERASQQRDQSNQHFDQSMQHIEEASPLRSKADTHVPARVYEQGPSFECAVCSKKLPTTKALKKHLRTHGKKMDCRRCGVKISSIKALRRHLDLNRCKALNGRLKTNKNTSKNKMHELRLQKEPMAYNDNGLMEGSCRCELCPQQFSTEMQLSLHIARKHGQTDCLLCGVKISSVKALSRHFDLNRCKALK